MKTQLRGTTTTEVMVSLVALSLLITICYGVQSSMLQSYRDVIHRERALLFAQQTFEQLESLRLTRLHQNPQHGWESFFGHLDDGEYVLVQGSQMNEFQLVPATGLEVLEDQMVQIYESSEPNRQNDFYSRLERRIQLESLEDEVKRITVSVYWGIPGHFSDDHSHHIRFQSLYADQTAPAFVL